MVQRQRKGSYVSGMLQVSDQYQTLTTAKQTHAGIHFERINEGVKKVEKKKTKFRKPCGVVHPSEFKIYRFSRVIYYTRPREEVGGARRGREKKVA